MSPTGKAGRPRSKPPVLKGKTQHERFVETAKSLEVDESGDAFERAMKWIAPPKAGESKGAGKPWAQVSASASVWAACSFQVQAVRPRSMQREPTAALQQATPF